MLLCQPAIHVRQPLPLQSGSAAVTNTHTDSCARHMPTDDDSTPRSSGRVAARRVSSESTDGDADGLQWGAVRGRRGGANPAASARTGQTPAAAGALPWGNGMGAPTTLWRLAPLLRYCSFSIRAFCRANCPANTEAANRSWLCTPVKQGHVGVAQCASQNHADCSLMQ